MKVLFATYPMAFHTPGGGEIQLLAYQNHLPAYGIDVSLFNPWAPRFMEHDVVHFFSCVGGSVHFCNFVKQLGLPLVVSSSLWVTEETAHLYPINEIRHQLSLADRVIANSDIECETLAKVLSLPREKFVTVYNGVESSFYNKVSADLFRDHFKIRGRFVLNVGNIEPRKNQLSLIRAIKGMPDLQLVLIGHQRDPAYARECLAEGGHQVLYLGPLEHDSPLLRSAYAAAEVFCLPSTLETPGLAALEAYAASCPIAITRIGSTKEYFGDQVEYLDPFDDHDIATAVQHARQRPAAAPDDGYPVTTFAQDLSWPTVLERLHTTYRSLV